MQDEKIFDDMVARLRATGKFRWVDWGRQDAPLPTEGATVHILRVANEADYRQANMDDAERRIRYQAILTYWNTNVDQRKRRMLNYEALIINEFNNKRLAGLTQPGKTLAEKSSDDNKPTVGQGRSITTIDGSFTYIVNHTDGINVEFV